MVFWMPDADALTNASRRSKLVRDPVTHRGVVAY